MSKVCKFCDRAVDRSRNGNQCHNCHYRFLLFRDIGYTTEEANYRLSFGVTYEGKVRYWTERLKNRHNRSAK